MLLEFYFKTFVNLYLTNPMHDGIMPKPDKFIDQWILQIQKRTFGTNRRAQCNVRVWFANLINPGLLKVKSKSYCFL
jgi:hypothetical protein